MKQRLVLNLVQVFIYDLLFVNFFSKIKCSRVDFSRPNERFYFVHYNGWNKK